MLSPLANTARDTTKAMEMAGGSGGEAKEIVRGAYVEAAQDTVIMLLFIILIV